MLLSTLFCLFFLFSSINQKVCINPFPYIEIKVKWFLLKKNIAYNFYRANTNSIIKTSKFIWVRFSKKWLTLSFENVKWEKCKWLQIFITYLLTLENSKNGLRSYPCCHWWIRYLNFYTASFCCEESTLHIQNHARRIADLDSTSCKKKTFKCI